MLINKNKMSKKLNKIVNSWFENVFGFSEESNYKKTRKKVLKNYVNNRINNISCGMFFINTIKDYNHLQNKARGKVTFNNIVCNITKIILDPANENATFQIASQFNCLEMINPNVTPADGIVIYENDHTQGPIATLCAPAALAYRNYIIDSNKQQLNTLEKVELCLPKPLWKMKNGYLLFENEKNLITLNNLLSNPSNEEIFRENIGVGNHKDVGICNIYSEDPKETHKINQVFCSGLPINYNSIKDLKLWTPFSIILLYSIYELTLLETCKNNERFKISKPCYLTMVGGGVFGMSHKLIKNAIVQACQSIANRGLSLDVALVHYPNINNLYLDIPKNFKGTRSSLV